MGLSSDLLQADDVWYIRLEYGPRWMTYLVMIGERQSSRLAVNPS